MLYNTPTTEYNSKFYKHRTKIRIYSYLPARMLIKLCPRSERLQVHSHHINYNYFWHNKRFVFFFCVCNRLFAHTVVLMFVLSSDQTDRPSFVVKLSVAAFNEIRDLFGNLCVEFLAHFCTAHSDNCFVAYSFQWSTRKTDTHKRPYHHCVLPFVVQSHSKANRNKQIYESMGMDVCRAVIEEFCRVSKTAASSPLIGWQFWEYFWGIHKQRDRRQIPPDSVCFHSRRTGCHIPTSHIQLSASEHNRIHT